MDLTVTPGEHSALGPSSSERWINCPGSVKASEGLPDEESIFAAEGTAAHHMADLAYRANKPAKAYIGDRIIVGKRSFGVTEEFAGHIQEYLDWCAEVPGQHLSEVRVDYGFGFGTIDRATLDSKTSVCTIRDLKFGKGVQVYAKENPQLMLYAFGVLQTFGWLYDIGGFNLGICQPRLDHKDEWYVSAKEVTDWVTVTLADAIIRVKQGTEFKSGDWCRFCRFRRDCAVRLNASTAAIFGDLDSPKLLLTPEDKARVLPLLPSIKSWIADFEKGVIADLIAGAKIAGWKLVAGRSNRAWSDPDAVAKRISPEDAFKKELRSPAQIEKILGKPKFKKVLAELVVKPPGRPVLAAPDDPREPLDTTSISNFTDLDSGES